MITKIEIKGFKSFFDFKMEFTPLTVIAGYNGAGKSNLFDALMLLADLATGKMNLKEIFKKQRGGDDFEQLFTKIDDDVFINKMSFRVEMLVSRKIKDDWNNEAEVLYPRLCYELEIERFDNNLRNPDLKIIKENLEIITIKNDKWIKIISQQYKEFWKPNNSKERLTPYIETKDDKIFVSQDGQQGQRRSYKLGSSQTVFTDFNTTDFPHVLAAKQEMKSWRFLQLNPADLRQPTKKQESDTISPTGKNLAYALFRIVQNDNYILTKIGRKLNQFLSYFVAVEVVDDTANQRYIIKLKGDDNKWFSSEVLSEGTLRLLALCILQYDEKFTGLICFEEPENGVHPYRIKPTTELLKNLTVDFSDKTSSLRQVIINTHSPIVLAEMLKLQDDRNVFVWFAEQKTTINPAGYPNTKLKQTNFARVEKQTQAEFFTFENTMPLHVAIEKLEKTDTENILPDLKTEKE